MTTVFSLPARAKAVQVDTVTPDEKAMLFYPTNPPVRNQLVANGILTTLQPKDETADLPASAVAIAERITAAYRAATDEAADHPDWQPEQVWKNIIDVAYAQLTGDLEHGDPERGRRRDRAAVPDVLPAEGGTVCAAGGRGRIGGAGGVARRKDETLGGGDESEHGRERAAARPGARAGPRRGRG